MTKNRVAGVRIRQRVERTENNMMDKLIEEVSTLVQHEYARASDKFGHVNHSDHESYAVLLEEFQEAQYEVHHAEKTLDKFWDLVKRDYFDDSKVVELDTLKKQALFAACELIQVAAMSEKAMITIRRRQVNENLCWD